MSRTTIPASERDAIFPFMVQRRNPATLRWLNISAQPTRREADLLAQGLAKTHGWDMRVKAAQ